MKKRLQILVRAFIEVFSKPQYALIAAAVSLFALFIAIWLRNWELLKTILFTETFSNGARGAIILSSFGNIVTNFSGLSRAVTLIVIVLFGINIAMLSYYLKCRYVIDKSAGAGFVGTVFGMLGVGCASCGSVVLTALFGSAFTASIIGILPFQGAEFGIIGSLLLLFSIYMTSRKIIEPKVCKIVL